MTAFNISFLQATATASSRVNEKGYRSGKYNSFTIDVVDFDNDVHTFEVEAMNANEAGEMAEAMAFEAGILVSYLNVYENLIY